MLNIPLSSGHIEALTRQLGVTVSPIARDEGWSIRGYGGYFMTVINGADPRQELCVGLASDTGCVSECLREGWSQLSPDQGKLVFSPTSGVLVE